MVPAIEIRGLRKRFGGQVALDGIDLVTAPRGIVAVLGPNGAGKTTLIRVLATLARPDEGFVSVAGLDISTHPDEVRRRISLTGQFAAIDELQTGRENLEMIGRLQGLERGAAKRRADELMAMFDLAAAGDRLVKTYSGGMRRRLDIGCSLVRHPEVLFLVEPTTGLDPRSRQNLWDAIRDLADQGVAILLTTQYLEEADRLADRIVVLDGGRVVADGTAAVLKAAIAGHRLELVMANDEAHTRAVRLLDRRVLSSDRSHRTLAVPTDATAGDVHRLLGELIAARVAVERVMVTAASLDDVFLALTQPTGSSSV
jgi:ABC-2 type transport system ATP-binding protein